MIIVIAFIAVCETVIFFARRSPLVAKLYGLGYLFESDGKTKNSDADVSTRDEDERL